MTTIYLIRHGQSMYNIQKIVQGSTDHEENTLSPVGVQQAQKLAKHLEDIQVQAIYSSPYRRAVHTATLLIGTRPLKVQVLPGLVEKGVGILEGHSTQEYHDSYIKWDAFSEQDRWTKQFVTDEETYEAASTRMLQAMTTISKAHPHDIVFAVSHANAIKAFYYKVADLNLNDPFELENCGYLIINVRDTIYNVRKMVNTSEYDK